MSTPTPRILVVEDDPAIVEVVEHYLTREGFGSICTRDGAEVLRLAREHDPDAVVLDLMLPGLDGLEVCRQLRAREETRSLPILILTARDEESDRIVGLELGADDYITKPFSPRELVARIKAVLRRVRAPAGRRSPVVRYGAIELNDERHTVTVNEQPVELTPKEFLLLKYFLEHPGRVLGRDVLLADVWGYHYTGGTRTVDVHLRRLREKLPLLAAAILTIKQFGYQLREEPPA